MSGGECLALKSIWLVAMAVLGVQPTTQSQTTLFHSFSYKMVAVVCCTTRFCCALRWIVRWSLENRVTRRRILLFNFFLFCTYRYSGIRSEVKLHFISFFRMMKRKIVYGKVERGILKEHSLLFWAFILKVRCSSHQRRDGWASIRLRR